MKEIENLIHQFDTDNLNSLLRAKTRTFRPIDEHLLHLIDDQFTDCILFGEFKFNNDDLMVVVTAKVNKPLSERSGKKAQYDLAKKILKQQQRYSSGFFIFYDDKGDFRFSLIYDIPLSTGKRDWSNFRRYTYFVSKDQTNKTFIKQFTEADFTSLEKIIDAFSVEKVTKQFYQEIANWYFWALKNVKFPDDAEAEKNGKEISVIRLITRLIFIWFMKVRKFVPEELFYEDTVKEILTDLKSKNDNYYKAILQNLFFATLNTKPEERRFTSKKKGYKGFSQDFGNHNVYRYEELFKDSEEVIEKYFMPIPFLNGGLFECLDYKSKIKDERKYIDGFTSTKSQQPIVPNFLFFSDDKLAPELNNDYGTTNKKYLVRGIINTLSLYNFTIDESDPNDADVALDPELLGKVFENLLASYNPETAKTARKSTGSYYTPRPIVDYMVDESLKQYFKTHLKSVDSILAVGNESADSILAIEHIELNNFFNPNDEIDIHVGNLPHWQQKNVWYFVTFRLADSLPKEVVESIKAERELWLKKHKKAETKKYSLEVLKEYYKLFSERIENLLDECKGRCLLRQEKIAKIVADTLLYFNNKKYILDDWVIMPNHVHILVKPINEYTLPEITHSWKSFTANEINKLLGSSGQLWLHESYDHIVRNEAAFQAIKNYIRNNPIKAKIKLPDCAQSWTYVFESKDALDTFLDTLFSEEQENPFDEATTKKLVGLIDTLRVVDPAVGSGAFPMRILNRLVFLLHKLDPDNSLWKQSQIEGIKKSVKDPILQRKLIEETERKFKEKNPDYGRKLYLIEKCIYGVDIQQIAVEIAKLRFFISLLVDEKVEDGEIEPLPNLDFKLMQGNSLISSFVGIDFNTKPNSEDALFDFDEQYKKLIDEFEELKSQYQNEPDVHKKRDLRDKIDAKLLEIFEDKLRQHYPQLNELESKYGKQKEILETEKKKLFKKIGIDLEQAEQDLIAYTEGRKPKDFFLWDVYFAEVFAGKGGFDIVIGNPPYCSVKNQEREKFRLFLTKASNDLFAYFFEKSTNILITDGILSFITSSLYIKGLKFETLRNFLVDNFSLIDMKIHGDDVFTNVQMPTSTFIGKKCISKNNWSFNYFSFNSLLSKISSESQKLGELTNSMRGLEIGRNKLLSEGKSKIISGTEVDRYLIKKIKFISNTTYNRFKKDKYYFTGERVLFRETGSYLVCVYLNDDDILSTRTLFSIKLTSNIISYKYLLALLNSKLMQYYYSVRFKSDTNIFPKIRMAQARELPIKVISSDKQKKIDFIVDKILITKQQNPSTVTKHLEDQIDIMVYKLYNLTYEEVKIIDPEIERIISKEEYEKFEIN